MIQKKKYDLKAWEKKIALTPCPSYQQLVETLAAVEEVKADQLQLVEILVAVEEVKGNHLHHKYGDCI